MDETSEPASENLGDQVEEVFDDVVEAVDDGLEDIEDVGRAMDDAVEAFQQKKPLTHHLFMWVFTLLLVFVVGWLCIRYYSENAAILP